MSELITIAIIIGVFVVGPLVVARLLKVSSSNDVVGNEEDVYKIWDRVKESEYDNRDKDKSR
jgi:hypothetical protein